MAPKRRTDVLFGGSLFGERMGGKLPPPPDPALEVVLKALTEGPKHRDWLRGRVKDPVGAVVGLRRAGHVVKSVILYGRTDWVYALSKNGRLCGVEGPAGDDPETAGGKTPAGYGED